MKYENLIGKKFYRLTILDIIKKQLYKNGKKNGNSYFCKCKCDCGNEKIVQLSHILNKRGKVIKSCGCYSDEYNKSRRMDCIVGKKINGWTILEECESINGKRYCICRCNCGKIKKEKLFNIIRGVSKSCGCLSIEKSKKICIKHGMAKTRLYNIWSCMKRRCYNKNVGKYKNYGGRGIGVCKEWRESFIPFYNWAIKSGYNKNAKYGECTIDRIDVNGNYCPENCRWVDLKIQQNNRRNNIYVTDGNIKESLSDACKRYGLDYDKAHYIIGTLKESFAGLTKVE